MTNPILDPLTLANGVTLSNRVMMAPMCDRSADTHGRVTDAQVNYMKARSNVAGILVTGYAAVSAAGLVEPGQLSVATDDTILGLKRYAAAMNHHHNKAILQLSHGGRESKVSQANGLTVYAPSARDFPWLAYPVAKMTESDIQQVVNDFATATKRAMAAGFDGVEIHNCNHDLLQQFFSSYSNRRTDAWGGSLNKRAALPLAVLQAVADTIKQAHRPDFILGLRISPEEIHGQTVGYTIDDMLTQIKAAKKIGFDYLNVSLTGAQYNYEAVPANHTATFAQLLRQALSQSIPVFIGSQIHTAADGRRARQLADGFYIARAALIDPQFTPKIAAGKEANIVTTMANQRILNVQLPQPLIATYLDPNGYGGAIPLPGLTPTAG
ncbi:oxidoreductase [Furfurilactobacillus curtus]|uniref:NADH-dependent oxidoreductase n=1 Tax=Furfurilactobacillus curtus TaxID=1746200 RepID=A0ABQ5JR97_9LACO